MDSIESLIALTSRDQRQFIELCYSTMDLSLTQALILEYLAFAERGGGGDLNQTELAERLDVRKPAIGAAIEVLVARGLVDRSQPPTDKRAWLVTLTPAGRDLVPEVVRIKTAQYSVVTAGLSIQQLQILAATLATIRGNLERVRALERPEVSDPLDQVDRILRDLEEGSSSPGVSSTWIRDATGNGWAGQAKVDEITNSGAVISGAPGDRR